MLSWIGLGSSGSAGIPYEAGASIAYGGAGEYWSLNEGTKKDDGSSTSSVNKDDSYKAVIHNRACLVNFLLFFFINNFIKFFNDSTRVGDARYKRFCIIIHGWYFWGSSKFMVRTIIQIF